MKWLRSLALASLAAASLVVAGTAVAADDPGVIPLQIGVGEVAPVGPGPVRSLVCDDASLVQPTDAGGSPGLRGLRAGTTLCSVTDALSIRRTYRVVVVEAGGSTSKPGGAR
jgi:hypothetical protein